MAKLYFTYGTMGSQKTGLMLMTAHNFEEGGGKVLVAKPEVDKKGGLDVVSRAGLRRMADFLMPEGMDIQKEVNRRRRLMGGGVLSALLIDEAQFLQPEQVDQLLLLAEDDGVPVMTYGLRTDFRTEMFPGSERLMAIAHVLRETITMCGNGDGCKKRAMFNARMVDGEYVSTGDQVAIDGIEKVTYAALCTRHYLDNVGPISTQSK